MKNKKNTIQHNHCRKNELTTYIGYFQTTSLEQLVDGKGEP
jgi:hypothetical protein